jgi:hypothetical protein
MIADCGFPRSKIVFALLLALATIHNPQALDGLRA